MVNCVAVPKPVRKEVKALDINTKRLPESSHG